MGINHDALMVMQAQLHDRIDQIIVTLPQVSAGWLVNEVNQIRALAHDCGLMPLSDVARGLGHALCTSHSATTARPYLEAMRDAVGCERLDPATSQLFLASISRRLHG
jgi:hypothetical protein